MSHRILDPLGSSLSLLSTIFYAQAWMLAWPVGLLATIVNGYLYFKTGLYGDMSLEGLYFISMFYGWYEWRRGGKRETPIPITHLRIKTGIFLLILAIIFIPLIAYVLQHALHSKVPYFDGITTILSLIAQWMTCRKILESWVLWFVVDLIYLPLYDYKQILFHSGLMLVYLALAILGYWRWRRLMRAESHTAHPML